MNQPFKDNKKRLWYLIYIIGLTVVLLYIKFPTKVLTNYIKAQAEERYPELNISFDKIGLSLSPGITIGGLKISLKEDPDTPVYVSKKSSVSLSILSWLKGDSKYYFESKVKDGEISGYLEEKDIAKKERIEAAINIEDIKLDENIFIHPLISQRIEGTVTGKIKFIGDLADPMRGNTEISLDMADGKFILKKPLLDMDVVDFQKISLSGVLDNRRLNIKDLDMTGGPVSGSASGTIQINNVFLSSRLRLKAEIEASPTLDRDAPGVGKAFDLMKNKIKDGKLHIDIRGTIDRPLPQFR